MPDIYAFGMDARGAIKSTPLHATPPELWRALTGDSGSGSSDFEDIITYYKRVTWLYRAVELRALAVASMPFVFTNANGDEYEEAPDFGFKFRPSQLFNQVEGWLTLYGEAYIAIERNQSDVIKELRAFHPRSVKAKFDENEGVTGYTRTIGNQTTQYTTDEIIPLWLPSREAEIGAGWSPAKAALSALATHKQSADFVNAFFKQSPLAPTIFTVDGMPPSSELEKVENWTSRMFAGLRNAFRTIAVRAGMNVQQLETVGVDKIGVDGVLERAKEEISAALGIPFSILWSNAANYATSITDEFNFYDKTIVPECELIASALNEAGVFERANAVLEFREDKLPSYQRMESERAKERILPLVERGVITINEARHELNYGEMEGDVKAGTDKEVFGYHIELGVVSKNEARALMGLPPVDEDNTAQLRDLQGKLSVLQTAVAAGIPVEVAAQMVGLQLPASALPDGEDDAIEETPLAPENVETPEPVPPPLADSADADADESEDERGAIRMWRKMAKRRYEESKATKALAFEHDAISAFVKTFIGERLPTAETWDKADGVFAAALEWAGYP